jgi:hypothetical protein
MPHKILTALLIAAAFITATTAVPSLVENVVWACNKPSCD